MTDYHLIGHPAKIPTHKLPRYTLTNINFCALVDVYPVQQDSKQGIRPSHPIRS
jgi:hypothetical protein